MTVKQYHSNMDPKKAAQLDPKLQEAYDRVMGVATNPAQPAASPAPVAPAASPSPIMPTQSQSPAMPVSPVDPMISGATPSVTPTISPQPDTASQPMPVIPADPTTPNASPAVTAPAMPAQDPLPGSPAKPHAFVAKKGMKVSPVILAVGGIAFLVVYTLIWVKVFNLQLPFLPQ